MTSSTRGDCRSRRCRSSGFTLVELVVVIGIIVLLMAILLPVVNGAYRSALRSRMEADLQVVSSALDAYRADFDQYPQVINPGYGADTLFLALVGPNGSGFRVRPGGKVWGPYLPPGRVSTNGAQILDRYGHPILYYPGKKGPGIDITQTGGYMGAKGMFNPSDNDAYGLLPATRFQMLMGDTNGDGAITGSESAAYTGNYVLWSAGPDEIYGPVAYPDQPVSPQNRCDDVANFPRREY